MPYFVTPAAMVNTTTDNRQSAPDTAQLKGGGHVVVWSSAGQDGYGYGIYAQRFNAAGDPVGGETRVNTTTEHSQLDPEVIGLTSGDYLVVWRTDVAGAPGTKGIFSQRYDASGTKQGGETNVSPSGSNYQIVPLEDGGYVIAWESASSLSSRLVAQRFDASGNTVGNSRELNAGVSGPYVSLAPSETGFIATWRGFEAGQSYTAVQTFTADGIGQGPIQRIASAAEGGSEIVELAGGGYVVVWQTDAEVKFQLLATDGSLLGGINTIVSAPPGVRLLPAVTATSDGGFAVAWNQFGQGSPDGGGFRTRLSKQRSARR